MFSAADIIQIQQKGITTEAIYSQLEIFKKGVSFLNVSRPASISKGIFKFDDKAINELIAYFEIKKLNFNLAKFVPASGAATRMFKSLYEYLEDSEKPNSEAEKFKANLTTFAFYNELYNNALAKNNNNPDISLKTFIETLLFEPGLGYGSLPKGLLKFHNYGPKNRVPVEEHLSEGALYACNSNKQVSVHFTISPEHISAFNTLIKNTLQEFETNYGVKINVTWSVQKASTDTIAADYQNKPFRDKDGKLVFRPGGHGALIQNLNELQSDVIFIKNIDNVVPDRLKPETIRYKLALGGLLLKMQEQISEFLSQLEKQPVVNENLQNQIKSFIENNLGYQFPHNFNTLTTEEKRIKFFEILNRPLRVCGMVKNSGEPGGGPFWVKKSDGSESLQILESSQFNLDEDDQREIFKNASHFNPVDLVIFTKDFKGKKFDLTRFTDANTCFISIKSKDGKELKALELPGLWNGAMANWNTLFVEVPVITFNPVKTVIDLLRNEHQA